MLPRVRRGHCPMSIWCNTLVGPVILTVRQRTPQRACSSRARGAVVDLVDRLLTSFAMSSVSRGVWADAGGSCRRSSRCFPAAGTRCRSAEVRGHVARSRSLSWWANSVPLSCGVADARADPAAARTCQLRPDALAGGLVRNDAGHEEPRPPLHLVCRLHPTPMTLSALPMAERAPAVGLGGRDGHSAGDRCDVLLPRTCVRLCPRGGLPSKRPAGWSPSVDGLRAHAHERIVRHRTRRPAARAAATSRSPAIRSTCA